MSSAGSPERMSPLSNSFLMGVPPSQQQARSLPISQARTVPAAQTVTTALSSGELEILTRVVKQYVVDPLQQLGSNPTTEQVGVVYQNIMKLLPQSAGSIKDSDRTEERKRINSVLMVSARKECMIFGKYLVEKKQASSLREAGEKLTNAVGGIADVLGCLAYVELHKKPIDTTGLEEAFQRLSLTESSRVAPAKVSHTVKLGLIKKASLELKYPFEYYKQADEGIGAWHDSYQPCIAKIDSPNEDLRILSQLETEYLIAVFDDMIRNPIKKLGDLKKLPPEKLVSALQGILESCYPLLHGITQKDIPLEYVPFFPGLMFDQEITTRVGNLLNTLYNSEYGLFDWLIASGNEPDKEKLPSLWGRKIEEFETPIFLEAFSLEAFHRMQKNGKIDLMKLTKALRPEFMKRMPRWDFDPTGTQVPTW